MKLALSAIVSLALGMPALAQPPVGKTDWTKPVVGVDQPAPMPKPIVEDVAIPIEVYTVADLKADVGAASVVERHTPVPLPCEPPVAKGPAAAKPPPPAPCPAPPR